MVRIRRSTTPGPTGTMQIGSYPPTTFNSQSHFAICEDVVGNFNGQNPLRLTKAKVSNIPVINGVRGFYTYINCPVSSTMNANAAPSTSSWLTHGGPKFSRSASQAAAGAHPGEPAISLPNFLFELKDLPRMYRAWARRIGKGQPRLSPPKEAADAYLEYQFAWRPLISDLMSLYEVAEWTESRARYIAKADAGKFISRRSQRGSDSLRVVDNRYPYNSRGGNMWGSATHDYEGKAWVSTRWRYNRNFPLGSFIANEKHRLLASALGLDIGFQTFWDAMPWSWMVDYFTDLSSVISVHRNRAGFTFAGACNMEYTKLTSSIVPYPFGGLKLAPYTRTHEQKNRTPFSPSIADVGINFLNGRQLSILGALLVSRS